MVICVNVPESIIPTNNSTCYETKRHYTFIRSLLTVNGEVHSNREIIGRVDLHLGQTKVSKHYTGHMTQSTLGGEQSTQNVVLLLS